MGPLSEVKVIELGGIGPGPFGCMLLSDMGADVIRVERVQPQDWQIAGGLDPKYNIWNRGRRSICIDFRHEEGIAVALELIKQADVVVEGFRPGVAERLGLGPDRCMALNPALIYARITGWGQSGPLAQSAGHDINYIALTGALHAIGDRVGPPIPPLNLVADLGGGGMPLAYGIVCALLERVRSGQGQIVDAAMVDGVASLMSLNHGFLAAGGWSHERGGNVVDGGLPWYAVYETADGRFVSIGALEPRFYQELLVRLGLDGEASLPNRDDRSSWSALRAIFAETFKSKTRAAWEAIFAGSDACFAPVLALDEAPAHPHLRQRGTYVCVDGVEQPRPTPRFSRTNHELRNPPPSPGQDTDAILEEMGLPQDQIRHWRDHGVIA